MNRLNTYMYLLFAIYCFFSCKGDSASTSVVYHYIQPHYEQVGLKISTDTIDFSFRDSGLYYKIRSFNVFKKDTVEYIAFFDGKELYKVKHPSISIHNFSTRVLITQIPIARFFENTHPFFTMAYVMNFDSVIIITESDVRIYDSSGLLKKIVHFEQHVKPLMQYHKNGTPPVFSDNKLYTGIRPQVTNINPRQLRKENVLCEFDLQQDTTILRYKFPDMYYDQDFGYPFLSNYYCYNDSGRFVFSFAADTAIYETDLSHFNHSYYGKSMLQADVIKPVENSTIISKIVADQKNFDVQDAYGVIYFDKYRKRYLRIVYRGLNEADFKAHKKRSESVIIFNEHFQIIGETQLPDNVDLERLFFTGDGKMYAELLPKMNSTIRFVRIEYK